VSTWCPKASQEFWVDLVLKKGTEKTSSMQSEHYSDVIIGSGPCGYAAAKSQIDLGRKPLVIDFGLIPQSENLNTERISKLVIKTAQERNSVFEYPEKLVTSVDNLHIPVSNARGGLSKIWGAGILLRQRSEMTELASIWAGIENGYEHLLQDIPHVGADDRTSIRFPWPLNTPKAPQSSRMNSTVESLQSKKSGPLIGWPRLALENRKGNCIRCGQCLNGCPLNLFFSAGLALEELRNRKLCSFKTGPVLTIERRMGVLHLRLPDGEITANRIFLAAGPIASPALLQRSDLAPKQLSVRDSAVFYTGFYNSSDSSGLEADYTSSHMVAYSDEPGKNDFQLAIYESNPEYSARLGAMLGGLGRYAKIPKMLTAKINAGIGFLDSSVSGSLLLNYSNGTTSVTRDSPKGLSARAKKVVKQVTALTSEHGIHALPKIILVPPPGSGYHCGASMPMGGNFVDINGQLKSLANVFVVDSSVLPEIWAGSHTFTAMANAYRIVQDAS
jgi:choline dehydrogenase-like flavoprotein